MVNRGHEFRLPGPEYEGIAWVHNEHLPGSATILERTVRARSARPQADGLPGSIYINGYHYSRDWRMPSMAGPFNLRRVETWQERLFPEIEAARIALDEFDPASVPAGGWLAVLSTLDDRFDEVFGRVHMETMGEVLPASARWLELHAERFGAARRDDALALLAGFPNTSTARGAALWELSRLAIADAAIRADIEEGRTPVGGTPQSDAFLDGYRLLIEHFGDTTTMHLLDLPTWREDGTIPLAMIAAMARDPRDTHPGDNEERAAVRRLELEAELAAASLDAGAMKVLAVAQYLAPISEDHNLFCDQRLIAASRRRWLRVGDHLVGRSLLQVRDDVFYLSFAELLDALERQQHVDQTLLDRRRAQQARWRVLLPPARLGGDALPLPGDAVLRGIAGSPGVYRGRARLIASLEAADSLEPGDVLVCAATAPEWTPYFGIVGALVTGAGGALTHGAVVAREFGIPAVVGVSGATAAIDDGAYIEVDGWNGTVTIEGGAVDIRGG